jgi:AcrR family transcriptional regulator
MPRAPGTTGQDTKERIFQTAVRMFSERGFNGVSVRDITGAVGIKESSLYNHFASKDALISAIYETFRERLLSRTVTAETVDLMLDSTPAAEYFKTVFALYAQTMTEPFAVMVWRILVSEQFHDPRANKLYNEDIGKKLQADTALVLSRMIARSLIKDVDVEVAARGLVEGIKGMLFRFIGIGEAGKTEFLESAHSHIAFFWNCVKN